MTDRFLDCGDIFKVSHERQGTSEMEENHHSTGLQFLIILQQPGLERDGGGDIVMFLCMSGEAATKM